MHEATGWQLITGRLVTLMNTASCSNLRPRPAVILVAGPGRRLLPLMETQPKCFVPVLGRRILDQALAPQGCRSVKLAVRLCASLIRSTCGMTHLGMDLDYVENSASESTNSQFSLLLGLAGLDQSNCMLEEDVCCAGELLQAQLPADLNWLVDSHPRLGGGAFARVDPEGRTISLGAGPSSKKGAGVLRASRNGVQALCRQRLAGHLSPKSRNWRHEK